MASLPDSDVTKLTLLLSAGTYGVYHYFEPAGLGSAGALLLAVPLYITWQAHYLYSSLLAAFISTFITYYFLIVAFTIFYRLSSFHPLAKYPGPVACKVSKFWMAFVVSRGYTHKYISKLHNDYGDVIRTGPNELSFRDDEATITILKEVEKGPYYDCRNQKGVIPLDGIKSFHDHAIRRRLWTKAFNIGSAQEHAEDLRSCIDELLIKLYRKQASVIDIGAWISFLSYDFTGHVVFGASIGMIKAEKDFTGLAKLSDNLAYIANVISHIPWIWPFLQAIPSADAPLEIPRKVCKDLVRKRMESNTTTKRDLYYYLLDEDSIEVVKPDETVALIEGTTAIIAGSDTASAMMTHALFFLMRRRSVLRRVQAELDAIFDADGAHPDYTKNIETPYLSACINETMRVYPALLAALQRRVELGSGGKMIASHFVPEGTQVTVSLFTMHRDPRHFSPIPETFWPDRWLAQESYVLPSGEIICKDDLILNRSIYLPFSYGQQHCPGKVFANMEMKAVLSAILHNFDINLAAGSNLDDYEASISDIYITRKGSLPVELTARR